MDGKGIVIQESHGTGRNPKRSCANVHTFVAKRKKSVGAAFSTVYNRVEIQAKAKGGRRKEKKKRTKGPKMMESRMKHDETYDTYACQVGTTAVSRPSVLLGIVTVKGATEWIGVSVGHTFARRSPCWKWSTC